MANQKYGMKIQAYCCGYWCQFMIPSTIPQLLPSISNVGTPIAVTLGANPNYSVVSTNGILSVTVLPIALMEYNGDENPALTAVVTGAVNGDTINYTLATTATQF
jgi:hypothetical protein